MLYMTLGQAIDFFGVNIFPTRVLVLAAFVRVLVRGEWSLPMLNGVDGVFLLAFGYRTAIFILYGNGSPVNMAAQMIDVTLAYFSFRGLLRSFEDLVWFLRALAILLIPYVAILYVGSSTVENPFAAIGGVHSQDFRAGRARCIGSFGHAAILGTFGASFLPFYIALALRGPSRLPGVLGLSLCLAIVIFSNSGGPLTCAMLAVVGWLLWFLRTKMSAVRTWFLAILAVLGLAMKAPLWYLPAKISDLTGGDGWHRSYLMQVAFRDLDKWWMAGMSALETRDWFPYTVVTGSADIINYYLDFGISAGPPRWVC